MASVHLLDKFLNFCCSLHQSYSTHVVECADCQIDVSADACSMNERTVILSLHASKIHILSAIKTV